MPAGAPRLLGSLPSFLSIRHRIQYRRLGRSGLQVSQLSLGSWVTYHNQVDVAAAREMLALAMDAGINFFDNAEAYAAGQSEVVMGEAFKALKWPRLN